MITVKLSGRLGNQMFQYSVCRIAALKGGYNFYIPQETEPSTQGQHIKDFFIDLDLGKKDAEISHTYKEDFSVQKFSDEIFKLFDNTELRGFFQTPKYFQGMRNDIASWFKLKKFQETENFFKKHNPNNYCVIHLRATDYKNHGHIYLKRDYYDKAMTIVKEKFPNISFVIITDDLESSSEMFPEIQSFCHDDMMIDFQILYESKINIIPNSTFSWWPAWLGNKEMVVAPNNWWNYYKPELGFYPYDIKTDEFTYI